MASPTYIVTTPEGFQRFTSQAEDFVPLCFAVSAGGNLWREFHDGAQQLDRVPDRNERGRPSPSHCGPPDAPHWRGNLNPCNQTPLGA